MKNPLMSAWLSWANRAAGIWIGAATAAAKRGQTAAIRKATVSGGAGSKKGGSGRRRAPKAR